MRNVPKKILRCIFNPSNLRQYSFKLNPLKCFPELHIFLLYTYLSSHANNFLKNNDNYNNMNGILRFRNISVCSLKLELRTYRVEISKQCCMHKYSYKAMWVISNYYIYYNFIKFLISFKTLDIVTYY